jgi:hypothetical protein
MRPDLRVAEQAKLICPTGKSAKTCPALRLKIFCFSWRANHRRICRCLVPAQRGVGHRHERWARDAMDAKLLLTNSGDADGKIVWS